MEVNKNIYFIAFLITVFLFATILIIDNTLSRSREDRVNSILTATSSDFVELQSFFLLVDIYKESISCDAFKVKLREMDKDLWDFGKKLDSYRVASEQFEKNPFYTQTKAVFNKNQMLYYLLLLKSKGACNTKPSIIVYFYKNSRECGLCDSQSFVLSDLKIKYGNDVSIFAFDSDIPSASITTLRDIYNASSYPCVVVNGKTLCGIKSSSEIEHQLSLNESII